MTLSEAPTLYLHTLRARIALILDKHQIPEGELRNLLVDDVALLVLDEVKSTLLQLKG